MKTKHKLFSIFLVCSIFILGTAYILQMPTIASADTTILANTYEHADFDDYFEDRYEKDYYEENWLLEEFVDLSGSFLQFFFILALAFFIPVRLMKTNLINAQQKQSVGKLYKWLWKIHIPVAVIGLAGIICHAVVAFMYENPFLFGGFDLGFLFTDHFSGLIAAILLLAVIITGILRRKQKGIWPHLIISIAFVIAYLIHG